MTQADKWQEEVRQTRMAAVWLQLEISCGGGVNARYGCHSARADTVKNIMILTLTLCHRSYHLSPIILSLLLPTLTIRPH
jgi:hypothetical protein